MDIRDINYNLVDILINYDDDRKNINKNVLHIRYQLLLILLA